jgi:glycine/D-amino acid oxidase-like deaminating enzyme
VTPQPGLAPPWWLEEAGPIDEQPPLEGDVEADVAIVGGGYTGLWTALALLERDPGLRVVLLEAEPVCGLGPSGRNGGFLETLWPRAAELVRLFGEAGAVAVARASEGALPAVRGLEDDVWLRERGMLLVSAAPAQDSAVGQALELGRSLGVPEETVPLTEEDVAARCRSPVFRRGVLYPRAATVQPARLVRALRRRALASGIVVHERTPVVRFRPEGVETPRGVVRAPVVVVATNAMLTGWRPTRPKLTVFGSYVVLTEPVPELLEELGWTGGEAIVDGRMFVHYFRTTPDGRVLMGSGSGPVGVAGRVDRRFTHDHATARRAEAGLRRLLPALARARVTHAWGGPIDVSADHVPFFGTVPGRRVHYGGGYSGNGVGPSWLGGQILASLALGRDDDWTKLPLANRRVKPLPPEPLRYPGGRLVRAAILACEEAEERGARGPAWARAAARLPRLVGMEIGTR